MNTNRQLIEQFLQFINTGDATIGKPIISDDVIFYAPTSPEPMKGFEAYMGLLAMMRGAMPDIQWKMLSPQLVCLQNILTIPVLGNLGNWLRISLVTKWKPLRFGFRIISICCTISLNCH